jgi:hypothetical protein
MGAVSKKKAGDKPEGLSPYAIVIRLALSPSESFLVIRTHNSFAQVRLPDNTRLVAYVVATTTLTRQGLDT